MRKEEALNVQEWKKIIQEANTSTTEKKKCEIQLNLFIFCVAFGV